MSWKALSSSTPVPFDGIENIDDLTLREAVWGCVYSIQGDAGQSFRQLQHRPRYRAAAHPLSGWDAYLAKLVGPSFKMNHKTFEMEDMTVEFDETTSATKSPSPAACGQLPRHRHQAV